MLIGARQYMSGGKPTAKSYVQDGLIAMWDGIENVGYGVHETSPSEWKNLIEGSGFPDFKIESGKSFGDKYLIVNGLTAESKSAWSSNFVVLEECYRIDSGYAFFNLNIKNRLQWGMEGGGTLYPQFSGNGSSGQNVFSYPEFKLKAHNSISVFYVSSGNSGAYQVGINGVLKTPTSTGNQSASHPSLTCIGSRKGVSSSYNSSTGILNCLRLYSRALTAAEVAANYAVDKERFGL